MLDEEAWAEFKLTNNIQLPLNFKELMSTPAPLSTPVIAPTTKDIPSPAPAPAPDPDDSNETTNDS